MWSGAAYPTRDVVHVWWCILRVLLCIVSCALLADYCRDRTLCARYEVLMEAYPGGPLVLGVMRFMTHSQPVWAILRWFQNTFPSATRIRMIDFIGNGPFQILHSEHWVIYVSNGIPLLPATIIEEGSRYAARRVCGACGLHMPPTLTQGGFVMIETIVEDNHSGGFSYSLIVYTPWPLQDWPSQNWTAIGHRLPVMMRNKRVPTMMPVIPTIAPRAFNEICIAP